MSRRSERRARWSATITRQLFWFMLVGALSTVLQTLVYVSAREVLPATWASWLALLAVTPANTEAHRRITFGVTTGAIGRLHGEAGLTSVVVYLANLVVAPWFAGLAGPHPSALTESMILALTGSLVGGARYLILRGWVFAAHRHPVTTTPGSGGEPADGGGQAGSPPAAPVRRSRRAVVTSTGRLCRRRAVRLLNQRPPGRIRTWNRDRRQHLSARS
ncbi:hypothetical protein [Actinoplanes sp. NPDC051851]|uniref:GtrA family protein n=1 Tax=Actinoplanes sp. NPDC051851 TaxID=3154753 RepID=UPI0034176FCB